jgi:hypothetical protein
VVTDYFPSMRQAEEATSPPEPDTGPTSPLATDLLARLDAAERRATDAERRRDETQGRLDDVLASRGWRAVTRVRGLRRRLPGG